MAKKIIITVARQYGSGGREIGERVAELLGIPLFDKQLIADADWGDLDYLFVDCPPGTGDVPLTVFQSLPIDGCVIVASPQELVGMIVKKAANMADMMNIPVLGLVENMSYLACPDCGKEHRIFGGDGSGALVAAHGIAATAALPIDPAFAMAVDSGTIESVDTSALKAVVYAAVGT